MDDATKTCVFNKIQCGYDLDLDDLHVILCALSENMSSGSYYEAATRERKISDRVKGYRKIGQQSAGRMRRNKTEMRNWDIYDNYTELTSNGDKSISREKALELLSLESIERYGVALDISAISSAITTTRKIIKKIKLSEVELPDF